MKHREELNTTTNKGRKMQKSLKRDQLCSSEAKLRIYFVL